MAVREEIRDIMTIFVGRMTNFMVVETLIIGIVAAMICEGELDKACPDFIAHSMYLCLAVSAIYLAMSLMFAVQGIVVAYDSSMRFLTQVVPDHMDGYDFDYMHQTTKLFAKEPGNRRWVPGLSLGIPDSYQNVEHLSRGACRVVHCDVTLTGLDPRVLGRIHEGTQKLELIVQEEVAKWTGVNAGMVGARAEDGFRPIVSHTGSFRSTSSREAKIAPFKVHVRVLFHSTEKAKRCTQSLQQAKLGETIINAIRNSALSTELGRPFEYASLEATVGKPISRYEKLFAPNDPRFQHLSSAGKGKGVVAPCGAESAPVDAGTEGRFYSYFDTLMRYSELWEPFARHTQAFMIHGITALCHGEAYYCLGRLYSRSERWAGITLLCLFVFLASVIFYEGMGARHVLRRDGAAAKPPPSMPTDDSVSAGWCFVRADQIVSALLVLGPLLCALVDKLEVYYPWTLLAVLACLCHVLVYIMFVYILVKGKYHSDREGPNPEGAGAQARRMARNFFGASFSSEGRERDATMSKNDGLGEGCIESQRRAGRDPEGLLREMLEEHSKEIKGRHAKAFSSLLVGNIVVALAWATMLLWYPLHYDFRYAPAADDTDFRVVQRYEVTDLPIPSGSYFKARGIACKPGGAFVADDFRVLEVRDQEGQVEPDRHVAPHTEPVDCQLAHRIQAITVSHGEAPPRSPLVLTLDESGSAKVINCSDAGRPVEFLQEAGPTDGLLAPIGRSSAITLRSGGSVTELEWIPGPQSFQPRWSMGHVDIGGAKAVDFLTEEDGGRRLFVFHSVWRQGSDAAIAVYRLYPPSSPRLETVWLLPLGLQALQGGCAEGRDRARLILQGDDGVPRLARVTL